MRSYLEAPMPKSPRVKTSALGVVALVIAVAVVLVVIAVGGGANGGLIECKGTSGIYREYDAWTERYERYVVPNDPACMDGER